MARGSTPRMGKPDAKGWAVVKDYCVVCRRVVYGYMPLNVPVPEPRCSEHREAKQEGAAALGVVRCVVGLALALVIVRDASLLSGWDRLGLVVVALVVLVVTLPARTR